MTGTAPASPDIQRHIPALDGLRALAILLVIPHNADVLGVTNSISAKILSVGVHDGWVGVTLFFALSGFLITGNLLETRTATNYYQTFFARRALRIFPLYYGVLIFTFVVLPLLKLMPAAVASSAQYQGWLWVFLSNWGMLAHKVVAGFPHFWSLAIEEQFYLLWPIVVHRRTPQWVLRFSIVIILIALALRCFLLALGATSDTLYILTFSRMDALAAGAAAAALVRIPTLRAKFHQHLRPILYSVALSFAAGFLFSRGFNFASPLTTTFGFSVQAITFAAFALGCALVPAASNPITRILAASPLRMIGKYSFGMYVFHVPLHLFVTGPLFARVYTNPRPLLSLAYMISLVGLSFLLAAVSYELYERRFLALRGRFNPRFS